MRVSARDSLTEQRASCAIHFIDKCSKSARGTRRPSLCGIVVRNDSWRRISMRQRSMMPASTGTLRSRTRGGCKTAPPGRADAGTTAPATRTIEDNRTAPRSNSITLRGPRLPLRNLALLFAPGSGVGLATAFTGILAPPSVECIVPSASVEPIFSATADQRILSATSTNQVVTI